MPSAPPLWQDRPSGEDHEWLAAGPPPPPRRARPQPEPPQPPRRRLVTWRRALASSLVLAAIAGAFVVGRDVVGSGSGEEEISASALPAVKGRPATTRINEIYAKVSAGVVSVQVTSGGGAGSGTGFVIDSDGTIVTNAHVVDSATRASVRFDDRGPSIDAEVVGTDPSSDIAVLHVDPRKAKLHPLALADSDDVRVGDTAIAVGYPLGLDRTATAGIISGLSREIRAPNGFQIDEVIQTDAPINPGNSGGPLIDANGRVIGINSQIATTGAGNVGIGFAVPSNTVREVVPQLKAGKSIERPYLGISTSTPLQGRGAVVREVRPGGPAEAAGVQAASTPDGADGDTILSIDGKPVAGPDDVAEAIESRKPGDRVTVRLRRAGGSESTVGVTLGRRPDQVSP